MPIKNSIFRRKKKRLSEFKSGSPSTQTKLPQQNSIRSRPWPGYPRRGVHTPWRWRPASPRRSPGSNKQAAWPRSGALVYPTSWGRYENLVLLKSARRARDAPRQAAILACDDRPGEGGKWRGVTPNISQGYFPFSNYGQSELHHRPILPLKAAWLARSGRHMRPNPTRACDKEGWQEFRTNSMRHK